MRGCLDFNPPFRNFPSPAHEFSPDGTHTLKLNTGFSGEIGMKEANHFVTAINNAYKALEEIQKKYPRNVAP